MLSAVVFSVTLEHISVRYSPTFQMIAAVTLF